MATLSPPAFSPRQLQVRSPHKIKMPYTRHAVFAVEHAVEHGRVPPLAPLTGRAGQRICTRRYAVQDECPSALAAFAAGRPATKRQARHDGYWAYPLALVCSLTRLVNLQEETGGEGRGGEGREMQVFPPRLLVITCCCFDV
jgi:hypothetical protein